MDLFMWELVISDRAKILPVIFKLAEEVEPRHGIKLRRMTRRSLRERHGPLRRGLQRGLERELGLRALHASTTSTSYAQELQLVFDRDWFMVAETPDGDTAAVAITMPDINQVLKQDERPAAAARLVALPAHGARSSTACAWASSASSRRTSTRAWPRSSTSSTSTRPPRRRSKWGEMGWILETNRNMNRAMEAMGGRIVRRFRVYERTWRLRIRPP